MKIVILEPIGLKPKDINTARSNFEVLNHELISYENRPKNDNEIISRTKDADIIILSNLPLNEKVIKASLNLKMISVAFAGVDHIAMDLCRKRKIIVSNAAGYSNHAVAELTIGSAINLLRKISWGDIQTRQSLTRAGFLGSELYKKTFGIIGLGQIGQEVAKLANAFGCKVLVFNRTIKDVTGVRFSNLDYLLKKSDILSIHIPLTKETNNLIGKNELNLMKPSSILINTARGPIVDTIALVNALKTNKIAGAAIDVYEKEPPLDQGHILFDAPNTILLPHIGYATNEAIKLRGKIVIENIQKWLNGNPQNVMN